MSYGKSKELEHCLSSGGPMGPSSGTIKLNVYPFRTSGLRDIDEKERVSNWLMVLETVDDWLGVEQGNRSDSRNTMAALVEGLNYGLSSQSSSNSNKSAFHVKLTDSALRAIEEFQKLKVCISLNLSRKRVFYIQSCTTYGKLILRQAQSQKG